MPSLSRLRSMGSQPMAASRAFQTPIPGPRVDVGRGRLVVPRGEGDLRFLALAQADERRGDGVFSLEDRFEPVRPASGNVGADLLEHLRAGHNHELRLFPLAVFDEDAVALDDGQVGALRQVLGSSQLGVRVHAVDLDLPGAGGDVELEQLGDPLELADRPRRGQRAGETSPADPACRAGSRSGRPARRSARE